MRSIKYSKSQSDINLAGNQLKSYKGKNGCLVVVSKHFLFEFVFFKIFQTFFLLKRKYERKKKKCCHYFFNLL